MQQSNLHEQTQQLDKLKVRIFDMSEQLASQDDMLKAIADKLNFKGNSFDELLDLITPKQNENTTQEEL